MRFDKKMLSLIQRQIRGARIHPMRSPVCGVGCACLPAKILGFSLGMSLKKQVARDKEEWER